MGNEPRILVVDDESAVVDVLTRYLRNAGCDVRAASSAEEAIALAAHERFDLVMLDVVLPGMTGFGAIAALRRQSDVPIIMMTGYIEDEARKDAELLGADGLIVKPVEFEKLLETIRGFRGREHGLQPR